MNDISTKNCPCCSKKRYGDCCQKYHQGLLPENALALMRSRYSAYALGLCDYIIGTTHPQSPYFIDKRSEWLAQINDFYKHVRFCGLEILETSLSDEESHVTFVAHLEKAGKDLTFTERSRFLKDGQAWKYIDGKIEKGAPKK